jgi:hypothetical protein
MSNTTEGSSGYENVSVDIDLIKNLVKEICIVIANGTSYCARLISIRDEEELWFETKGGQKWMVARRAITSIRPLHRVPFREAEA